jgi:outer membrane protein TolC
VEEALLTVRTRKTQKKLVQDNLVTAMENHRLAKARFDLGAASSLEVLDAEEDLAEAENLEVNYKYNTRTAQAALLYSIGALDLDAFGQGK